MLLAASDSRDSWLRVSCWIVAVGSIAGGIYEFVNGSIISKGVAAAPDKNKA